MRVLSGSWFIFGVAQELFDYVKVLAVGPPVTPLRSRCMLRKKSPALYCCTLNSLFIYMGKFSLIIYIARNVLCSVWQQQLSFTSNSIYDFYKTDIPTHTLSTTLPKFLISCSVEQKLSYATHNRISVIRLFEKSLLNFIVCKKIGVQRFFYIFRLSKSDCRELILFIEHNIAWVFIGFSTSMQN